MRPSVVVTLVCFCNNFVMFSDSCRGWNWSGASVGSFWRTSHTVLEHHPVHQSTNHWTGSCQNPSVPVDSSDLNNPILFSFLSPGSTWTGFSSSVGRRRSSSFPSSSFPRVSLGFGRRARAGWSRPCINAAVHWADGRCCTHCCWGSSGWSYRTESGRAGLGRLHTSGSDPKPAGTHARRSRPALVGGYCCRSAKMRKHTPGGFLSLWC